MLAYAAKHLRTRTSRWLLGAVAGFATGSGCVVAAAHSLRAASADASSSEQDDEIAAALEKFSQRLCRIESRLDTSCRVLVVGGGIIGSSIALQLTRQGCRVCLVEADGEPSHQSSRPLRRPAIDCTSPADTDLVCRAQQNRRRTAAQPVNHGRGSTRTAKNRLPIMISTPLRWSCGASKRWFL